MKTTDLKIKVCGMKFKSNFEQLKTLPLDFIGFIFYPPSKRNVTDGDVLNTFPHLNKSFKTTAVFVNENIEVVSELVNKYKFEVVQLHGSETVDYCEQVKKTGVTVFKVFSVDDTFNFSETKPFEGKVDFFLFDTKTPAHGGSGQKFNWQKLEEYTGNTPFLLSGGIDEKSVETIKGLNHDKLWGIDINSKFESTPGIKDIQKIKTFIIDLKKA